MKMRRFITALAAILTLGLLENSCDVHEFPEVPESRPHILRLKYETDLPVWNLDYSLQSGITSKGEVITKSVMDEGQMRYIIRTYPQNGKGRAANDHVQEFVFTRDIAEGYATEFTLDLIPGEWRIMVWSDLLEKPGVEPFYNYADFAQIKIWGAHRGNTDYRDAFRGLSQLKMETTIIEEKPDTTDILMSRPFAKFEFLSDDLKEFIDMEVKSALSKAEASDTKVDPDTKVVDIADYKVKIIYPAFMPNTYSMFTDKPVDSATGVRFDSFITPANETEASMGFDYVFVGEKQSAVTVQLAIFNKEGEQISLTVPVDVPLKRSYHTILKGSFLMQKASGGIGINPEFEGDHNIIL